MIFRLLKDLDPGDYCLISRPNSNIGTCRNEYSGRLPGKHYLLSPELEITRGDCSGLAKWRRRIGVLRVFRLAREIAAILRRERCDAVVACTGALLDPPAGYLASRLAGVPFYLYVFDHFARQWSSCIERLFAQLLEPALLNGAAGIIVPNEFLRDEFRRRYGVESTVIHNPGDIAAYETLPDDAPDDSSDAVRIVYTGAVYDAHYDAFVNLMTAIQLLERTDVELHLYTAQSPADLEQRGIRGPVVFHEHQPASTVPSIQSQADLLFLPLAFQSPYPEIIRTSAPGKMGEYLAAQRPILVHAPSESFVAWYFRRYGCGLVVDRSDPLELAQAIERILTDADTRRQLSARAWERARSDFSLSAAQSAFAELMRLDVPHS